MKIKLSYMILSGEDSGKYTAIDKPEIEYVLFVRRHPKPYFVLVGEDFEARFANDIVWFYINGEYICKAEVGGFTLIEMSGSAERWW